MHPFSIRKTGKTAREIDRQRQHFVLSFLSGAIIVIALLYSFEAASLHNRPLQLMLFFQAAAFLGNLILFYATGRLELCCRIAAVLVGLLVLGMAFYGGRSGYALYGIFVFPAALFTLLGTRRGLLASLLVVAGLGVLFYWPAPPLVNYALGDKTHALAALAVVILIGWLNEFGREHSQRSMEKLGRVQEKRAHTDALTGLFNRRYVDRALPRRLREQKETFFPLGVIACDLDHFKHINDQYGHDAGDQALKHIAGMLKRHLRQEDKACRSGGEEFLLLLPHCPEDAAKRIAEALRKLLESHPFTLRDKGLQLLITASFGVTVCHDAADFSAALKRADEALYAAKKAGRNRVEPADGETLSQEMSRP